MNDFTHLHVHTEYSTLDGFGNVNAYAKRAAEMGYSHLACTDHGSIDGLIQFQKACIAHKIIPISGCELYIIPKIAKTRKQGHLLTLIKNNTGFNNLCKILSFANDKGYYYKPRVTFDYMLDHLEGLVIATACPASFVNLDDGVELLKAINKKIGEDLYLEVMPIDTDWQREHNKKIIKLARKLKRDVFVSNDCHYVNRDDSKAQEVLLAIQTKSTWNNKKRWKFEINTLNLKSSRNMFRTMLKLDIGKKKYLTNTMEIAEKCEDFRLNPRKVRLPRKGVHRTMEREAISSGCQTGMLRNFGKHFHEMPEYKTRYEREMNVIEGKKFLRYFIIVEDFIEWCKGNNVLVGPGRGSVGCSLVAYLLGITTIDPIEWELPFERFITEDRIDFPDIDIDIEHTKIKAAIAYLEQKYGKNHVAGISTFNRMKSRAAIKDVARVFEINEHETNDFTKTIDREMENGLDIALESPEGIEYSTKYPEIIKLARKLEGQIRTRSKHAAGLVISRRNIGTSGRCNIIIRDGMQMVNWEKDDTEYMGLMKLDILSLKMLSILGMTRDLIRDNYSKEIVFEDIPLRDSEVINDINAGNVIGLFQVTGYATKSLIEQMPIEVFDDIVAVIALSRPGPLGSGMTNDYILRKNGGTWNEKHAIYESITRNTFGLLVYQEQIMAVIHKVAGLPYSTADKIRKVIGKKRDPKEFAKYKKQFVDGCDSEKTLSRKEAKTFWQGLQSWAKYGFNLAHSVEYATIAYWCAWLKHYYPTEFICSSLTFCDKSKKKELVEEAYRVGLELITPMVKGDTQATKWVAKKDKLYVPFTEVEGLGEIKAHEAKQTRMTASLFGVSKPHDDALAKTLVNIDAYREKEKTVPTRTLKKYFNFRISTSPKQQYKKLYKLSGNKLKAKHVELALAGDYKYLKEAFDWDELIHQPSFSLRRRFVKKLCKCTACDLKIFTPITIYPKVGRFNIAVIEEAKDSKVIWKAMKKRKYSPEHFYVTTVNKCMPTRKNDISAIEIDACSIWLNKELKKIKPVISIAFGNNSLYYFTGKQTGITALNGTTQWLEEYGMWICWCIHPSSTRGNSENKKHFKRGMSNFFRTLNATGFKNML